MLDQQRIDSNAEWFHWDDVCERLDHLQELADLGTATTEDEEERARLVALCEMVSPDYDDTNPFFNVAFVRISGPFSVLRSPVTTAKVVLFGDQSFLAVGWF